MRKSKSPILKRCHLNKATRLSVKTLWMFRLKKGPKVNILSRIVRRKSSSRVWMSTLGRSICTKSRFKRGLIPSSTIVDSQVKICTKQCLSLIPCCTLRSNSTRLFQGSSTTRLSKTVDSKSSPRTKIATKRPNCLQISLLSP